MLPLHFLHFDWHNNEWKMLYTCHSLSDNISIKLMGKHNRKKIIPLVWDSSFAKYRKSSIEFSSWQVKHYYLYFFL